jgi:hypothetical protein
MQAATCPRSQFKPASASQSEREMASQIVLDRSGDTRHMFNNQDRAEVAKAEQRFKDLTGAGFTAAVRSGPGEQRIIRSFRSNCGGNAILSAFGRRLTGVSQQLLPIGLALIGALLLSTLSLVGTRSGFFAKAFGLETEARALTLLKEWLSPKQRDCYERYRYFDVIGSHTGTRYRIPVSRPTSRN